MLYFPHHHPMKNIPHIIAKVLLTPICVMPIFGALGVFPAPTADLYNTPEAFTFIETIMSAGYINPIMAVVFLLALIALWTKREALTALLLLPLTVNIVAFHLMLDGGLFTAGAIMGNVLLVLNGYFLWQHRAQYKGLITPRA